MSRTGRIEVYRSKDPKRKQRWHWRAVASNGNILSDSAEGYVTRSKCKRAIYALQKAFANFPIKEV